MALAHRGMLDPWSTFYYSVAPSPSQMATVVYARVDWVETPEAHVFRIDMPGVEKKNIKVEIEDGQTLNISGERKGDEAKGSRWHRLERAVGNFFRKLHLPSKSKVHETKARVDNGVLTVTVPKEQQQKPEVRQIPVSD